MAKPAYPVFAGHVRRFMTDRLQTGSVDLAHLMMPQAARYPVPFRHFDVPYIVGPLGGALSTPEGFGAEMGSTSGFTRLRALDGLRFRRDPWLRASYAQAAIMLSVAPYMRDQLRGIALQRFEPMLELGIDELAPAVARTPAPGQLRLLHVGRGVRTPVLRHASLTPDSYTMGGYASIRAHPIRG